eukprot:Clim_evm61s148 gene=Clim_evmTU61s148
MSVFLRLHRQVFRSYPTAAGLLRRTFTHTSTTTGLRNVTRRMLSKPYGQATIWSSWLRHYETGRDKQEVEEKQAPAQTVIKEEGRVRKFFREYGTVGIGTYITIDVLFLGGLYAMIKAGFDMKALIASLGFPTDGWLSGDGGNFVVAYAAYKILSPLRFALAVVITPPVRNWLISIGFLEKGQFKEAIDAARAGEYTKAVEKAREINEERKEKQQIRKEAETAEAEPESGEVEADDRKKTAERDAAESGAQETLMGEKKENVKQEDEHFEEERQRQKQN